jgi:hypothetical protein
MEQLVPKAALLLPNNDIKFDKQQFYLANNHLSRNVYDTNERTNYLNVHPQNFRLSDQHGEAHNRISIIHIFNQCV